MLKSSFSDTSDYLLISLKEELTDMYFLVNSYDTFLLKIELIFLELSYTVPSLRRTSSGDIQSETISPQQFICHGNK